MEFVFETIYNQKAISTMAEALRKTIRRKRNKRTHILGWLVIILAIFLSIPSENEELIIDTKTIVTWIAVLIMATVLLFEDKINAYIARKRMLKGTENSITVFKEDGYRSTTNMGKTDWYYKNINQVAENDDYFIFIFDQSHAQVYDKKGITSGTVDDFRVFITRKTEKEIKRI